MDSITEGGVEYPRLTLSDYEVLENDVRAAKVAFLKKTLDECNVRGADRFVALRDAQAETVRLVEVREYLKTPAGARKAVATSLGKAGKSAGEAAEAVNALGPLDAMCLALVLAGFEEPRPLSQAGTEPGNASSPSSPTAPASPASSGSTTASE